MASINLPFICMKCGNLFPSGIVIGLNTKNFTARGCWATAGAHSGPIMDGTFDAVEGVLQIKEAGEATKLIVAKIRAHAQEAAAGRVTPQKALDEITNLLPPSSALAFQTLGATSPWLAILLILSILGGLTEIVANGATIYRTFFPSEPTAPVIDVTIINEIADAKGEKSSGKSVNREQSRRLKHKERHKKFTTKEPKPKDK